MRWFAWVGATLALAGALYWLLGPGYAGYDAAWSLVWGSDLVHGRAPSYGADVAPTPHPLANLVAAPLSLLGDGGEAALVALTFVAFAALAVGTFRLGTALLWWPAGLIAGAIVLTRGILAREVAFASIDVPFLALVVWAGVLEARRPARGWPVLALLATAGLLRPEAWLLSAAYVTWLAARARSVRAVAHLLPLAAAGPLLWAAGDLLVTGDPMHSFTGTRDLAAELDRPRGTGAAVSAVPRSLREILGTPVLLAGLLGAAVVGWLAPRRVALVLVAGMLGVLAFLAIGAADLPVLLRYLLVPALALAVTAGMAPVAWRARAPRPAVRPTGLLAATLAGGVAGVLLLGSVPDTLTGLQDARDFTRARRDIQLDLRSIARTPAFRAAARRCPVVRVPDFRSRPVILLDAGVPASKLAVGNLADREPGLVLTYRSDQAAFIFNLGVPGEVRRQAAPLGGRLVAQSPSWSAWAVC